MPSQSRPFFSVIASCLCILTLHTPTIAATHKDKAETEQNLPVAPPSSINLDDATNIDSELFPKQQTQELFLNYQAKLIPETAPLPKFLQKMQQDWKRIQNSYDPATYAADSKAMSPKNAHKWQFFYKKIQKASPIDQLRGINGFINTIPSKDDNVIYKQTEYWASPQEMFKHWMGDCEDYVFAKYFALKYLQWPEQDLRVLLVYDKPHKMPHAVLAVQFEGKTYILDNLAQPKHRLFHPEHYAKNSVPLFTLNTQGIWIFEKGFKEYLDKYREPKKEGLAKKREQQKAQAEKSATEKNP